jgi:glucose/arabinose dehydrogenase
VHRTPWTLIIAGIVVLVLLMAGCGTALAVLGSRSATNQGGGLLPSPSPAGTPTPGTTPTPITTAGGTVSNNGVAFKLPAGWTVANKDDQSITVTSPDGSGSITVGSGASNPPQNAQQNKDTLDKFFTSKYPDTKTCPGSKTSATTLNGAAGIVWELCFTLTSGGQSIPAAAPLFAGANADGSVYYVILILARQADVKALVNSAGPLLDSIQWKLT